MHQMKNCKDCNKLFFSSIRDICTDCYKAEIEILQEVKTYLRKNSCSIFKDVIDNTNASEEKLTKFILQKRIILKNNPNRGVPCKICEGIVVNGDLCNDCRKELEETLEAYDSQKEIINRTGENALLSKRK